MSTIYKELGINPKKTYMISFVGGGGKTSHMFTLANELKEFGRVIVTTTTKILLPRKDDYDNIVMLEEGTDFLENPERGVTLLGKSIKNINKINKVVGVDKNILDKIYENKSFQFILIEADGAKEKPLKASNETEPIIPDKTNINIGIIGFDALDEEVTKVCFREDRFKTITGKDSSDIVDDDSIISLINHEKGLFKETPEKCKRFFVISKCDDLEKQNRAKRLLEKVIDCCEVDKAFISSIHEKVFKRHFINVSAIIMASGLSRRMGRNKLIMKINGVPMVERVVRQCISSHIKETIVVYNKEEVLNLIKDYPVKHVYNSDPEKGQSVSIKLGVNEADKSSPKGYMFLVADQPFIDSKLINTLLRNFIRNYDNIVLPIYDKKNGSPVIFPCYLSEKFNLLKGDNGGKDIIRNCENISKVYINDSTKGLDVDTEKEYESIGGNLNG